MIVINKNAMGETCTSVVTETDFVSWMKLLPDDSFQITDNQKKFLLIL